MRRTRLDRRTFLRTTLKATAGLAVTGALPLRSAEIAKAPSWSSLPRWRGFNLLEKFVGERSRPFREADFEHIAAWGFDFVRLPLSYRAWAEPVDWLKLREDRLREIDEAVAFGKRHRVHVNVNLHRAPGYCVNPPAEPLDLWSDEKALEACAFHWAHFARRYQGVPNTEVSFDLLNEPANVPEATYARVVRRLVEAIRKEDPERLIVADGLRCGRDPVHSIVELKVAQSTRGYDPMGVSHYKASWVGGADRWPEPTWPLGKGDKDGWDRDRLRRERIAPWQELARKGVGVHVGEWGAFRHTPHRVALAWMRDSLELWKEAGWGWALWNLRGDFGVLDSNRADVKYEDWKGHKLDREMLELLRGY
jgi:endoglucanase